jgi:hypothetical protein
VVLIGVTLKVPPVASLPLQPPLAVHDVAFVLDQLRFVLLPVVIVDGLADRFTVG